MKKVIAYVDGFNLYYGLKDKGWRQFYWLNIQLLVNKLLKADQQLIKTNYFTAKVKPESSKKRERQKAYINALRTLSNFEVFYGRYKKFPRTCNACKFTEHIWAEKMTDVKIAVAMLSDAYRGKFDVALLISGDSDLTPVVRSIKQMFPDKRVVAVFPPERHSDELKSCADGFLKIGRANLAHSVFPDEVERENGSILQRPSLWK